MRRHASPWTPRLGHFRKRFCVRPLSQTEGNASRFLDGEIAGRKCVRVAETEQEINVGSPWTNAVKGGQGGMRLIGAHIADCREINPSSCDGLSDFPD